MPADDKKGSGSQSTDSLSADVTKLKAQFESFGEIRKVYEEKFTHLTETLGELRGTIMETNRDLQQMQIGTSKAVQMVEAVHPEALMSQVRKQEAKIEVLKASIESSESRMDTILKELKEIRNSVRTFSGIDKVVKLSQEVKEELINIKRIEGVAERHSDKMEGLYIDFQKRVREISDIESTVKDNSKKIDGLAKNYDTLKTKVIEKAEKKDVDSLVTTSKEFERHITKSIELLNKVFVEFEKEFTEMFNQRLKQMGEMEDVLKKFAKDSPNIGKNVDRMVEYIDARQKEKAKQEKRTTFIGWVLGKFAKKKKGEGEEGEEGGTPNIKPDDDDGLSES